MKVGGGREGDMAHLSILGERDVNKGLGCRVDHIQQLHDGGTVIGDGSLAFEKGGS